MVGARGLALVSCVNLNLKHNPLPPVEKTSQRRSRPLVSLDHTVNACQGDIERLFHDAVFAMLRGKFRDFAMRTAWCAYGDEAQVVLGDEAFQVAHANRAAATGSESSRFAGAVVADADQLGIAKLANRLGVPTANHARADHADSMDFHKTLR